MKYALTWRHLHQKPVSWPWEAITLGVFLAGVFRFDMAKTGVNAKAGPTSVKKTSKFRRK